MAVMLGLRQLEKSSTMAIFNRRSDHRCGSQRRRRPSAAGAVGVHTTMLRGEPHAFSPRGGHSIAVART